MRREVLYECASIKKRRIVCEATDAFAGFLAQAEEVFAQSQEAHSLSSTQSPLAAPSPNIIIRETVRCFIYQHTFIITTPERGWFSLYFSIMIYLLQCQRMKHNKRYLLYCSSS